MLRFLSIATMLLASAGLALAQPAPPAPADPAPMPPTEPAPLVTAPPAPPMPTLSTPDLTQVDQHVLVAHGVTPDATVHASYDGGVKLESDDGQYELKLQFRNQIRFESTRVLDDTMTGGASSQFQSHFYVPRTRLQAEGYVFGSANRYKLEVGLGESGSFSFVKDVFIEKELAPTTWFRMGQWKRPFNRSEFVSDFNSIFNERSIQNELAGGGRDLGAAIHNDYEKTPEGLDYVVGVFNGFSGGSDRPTISSSCSTDPISSDVSCVNGRPVDFPADFGPTLVFRADWNSAKMKGLSEGDLEGGPLRYSVGAAYKVDLANFSKHGKDSWGDNTSHGVEVDANIKAHGFSLDAGFVVMKLKDADADWGVFAQPGYMVVPTKVLVAARFAAITENGGDRKQLEARAALDYLFHGHTWKIASDVGFLKKTEAPTTLATDKPDLQARIMMQLSI
jgi:hypothetical protein